MKKNKVLSLTLTVFLLLGFSGHSRATSSYPGDPGRILVITEIVKDHTLNLRLANLDGQRTVLTLNDPKGRTLFSRGIKWRYGYSLEIDLSKLPEGQYTFTVSQKRTLVKKTIRLNNYGILLE